MAMDNTLKNLVKFGRVVFELYDLTDEQTDKQTYHNTVYPSRGRGN